MKTRAERQIARGGVGESTVDGPPSESLSEQYSLAKILGIWAAAALPQRTDRDRRAQLPAGHGARPHPDPGPPVAGCSVAAGTESLNPQSRSERRGAYSMRPDVGEQAAYELRVYGRSKGELLRNPGEGTPR